MFKAILCLVPNGFFKPQIVENLNTKLKIELSEIPNLIFLLRVERMISNFRSLEILSTVLV